MELPTPWELQVDWKCALKIAEISNPESMEQELYIYCDICQYSYVADGYKPILRIVNGSDIFETLFYQPITTSFWVASRCI